MTHPFAPEVFDAICDAVAARLRKEREPEVLTVRQCAERAQVSPVTVRRWIRAGRLQRIPGLRSIRVSADHLNRLINQ